MGIRFNPISGKANAVATLRRSSPTGSTLGYGPATTGPDPSTDTQVNVLITPFDVIRRLAFLQAMGGSIDIRLWWVITENAIQVSVGDEFIVQEYGQNVTYIVQMEDPELYLVDTTVCICKKV